jgi:hypothetical protein
MEEDLELFNDNGLEGFGQLLANALKRPITAPAGGSSSEDDDDASFFPLQLTYRFGSVCL